MSSFTATMVIPFYFMSHADHGKAPMSWQFAASAAAGMFAFVLFLCSYMGVQRVEIDTVHGSIKFANLYSHQRWREFKASEVISIRRLCGYHNDGLLMELAPSRGRSWNDANFFNTDTIGDSNSALILALVGQVTAIKPNMKVDGLLPQYQGPLPRGS
ncbi:hypothetical protein [Dyella silvatica]|uniref:hypothetical protein n=1 Tax=Dyella silvatica TaxID=2992128 RepID=UPI00225406D8|nr:hypothetical protein [Dyella silvatica]